MFISGVYPVYEIFCVENNTTKSESESAVNTDHDNKETCAEYFVTITEQLQQGLSPVVFLVTR